MRQRQPSLNWLIGLIVGISILGCSAVTNPAGQGGQESSRRSALPAEAGEAHKDATNAAKADERSDLTKLGLAEFCSYEALAVGKGRFTCTPRDLPLIKVLDVPEAFDPKSSCSHDFDKMTCSLDGSEPFVFDFEKRSSLEDAYEKLPLIIFGAKAILGGQLDKLWPEHKSDIFAALDLLNKHKKSIFTGENPQGLSEDAVKIAQKAQPELTAEQLASIKLQLESLLGLIDQKRKSGEIKPLDIVALASKLLASMPSDLAAKIPEDALGPLTEALKNGDGGLADLLATLGDTFDE